MKEILLHLPEKRILLLDELVAKKQFSNRNEAIREAVREFTEENDNWRQVHLVRSLLKSWNEGKTLSSDRELLLTLYKICFPRALIVGNSVVPKTTTESKQT